MPAAIMQREKVFIISSIYTLKTLHMYSIYIILECNAIHVRGIIPRQKIKKSRAKPISIVLASKQVGIT